MKIVWSNAVVNQFSDLLKWIAEDSILQVESEIIKELEKLLEQPERYPSDKFKLNNGGEFRAFEMFNI